MSEPTRKRGRERTYDAERTRTAILNAAEALFAEHGFDGTSVDAIATQAAYNKSLIFQYFGDKLGLYTQVLKRADAEMGKLITRLVASVSVDDAVVLQVDWFRAFLATMVQTIFDYLLEHPRLVRMLTWEMADGWQTFAQIASQFPPEDTVRLEQFFHKVYRAGLLRSDFVPLMQLTMMLPLCQTYLAYLPLYQRLLPGEDISPPDGIARMRKYVVDFVVAGLMNNLPETKTGQIH